LPKNLRTSRILPYARRTPDPGSLFRRYRAGTRSEYRADRARHRCRDKNAPPARETGGAGCLYTRRYFKKATATIGRGVSENFPYAGNSAGLRRLPRTDPLAVGSPRSEERRVGKE